MGKRGPGDQSDPQPPYGYSGDGQWHMGNYLKEGQQERDEASLRRTAAENDAGETMGGRLPGQQNMGAYINANKKK